MATAHTFLHGTALPAFPYHSGGRHLDIDEWVPLVVPRPPSSITVREPERDGQQRFNALAIAQRSAVPEVTASPAALTTAAGGLLASGVVIGMGVWRFRTALYVTTHGSARWAEREEMHR
jgi:hypothetical protein